MSDGFRLEKHPIVLMQPSVVPPFGWVGHIPFAYLAVDLLRPDCIVELGTHSGNSYLAMCQAVRALNLSTRCWAVDTWHGDSHAGHYGEQVYQSLRARHDPRYGEFSTLVRACFDDAVLGMPERSIDLLHIDGLHTYEAVKHDFETWLPKLSGQAVVLLHDIATDDNGFGARRFFDELSQRYPCFDFLHSHGLGVVAVGEALPAAFASFMHAANADPAAMRAFFEGLAGNLVDESGRARTSIREAQPLVCYLYYRNSDESFDDERKISIQVDAAEEVLDVRFRLPPGVSPGYLRIDPSDHAGIYSLQVWLNAGDAEVPKLLPQLRDRIGRVQGELLPDVGPIGIRFANFDDDPYVEIEVGSEIGSLSDQAVLEVTVRIGYEVVVTDPSVRRLMECRATEDMRELAAARADVQAIAREMSPRLGQMEITIQQLAEQHEKRLAERSLEAAIQQWMERHATLQTQMAERLTTIERAVGRRARPDFWGGVRRTIWCWRGGVFDLQPTGDLECVSPAENAWRTTDGDPGFICASAFYPLRAGWYRVSVDLEIMDGEKTLPKLYFDFGHGMQENESCVLNFVRSGASRHDGIVLLPRDVYGMRFDPTDSASTFRIDRVALRPVTRASAAWQMLQALKATVPNTLVGDTGSLYKESIRRLRGPNGRRAFATWLYGLYTWRKEPKSSYERWLDLYDKAEPVSLAVNGMLISILLPTYNTAEKWLRRCLDSVLAQTYSNWELCIADDASTQPHVRKVLEEYRSRDSRIRVKFRSENGHISTATNSALAQARGSFIAFLDHDDELHPQALAVVASALLKNPQWQLVYSDEDKIDEQGRRYDPYFKPDWNPDLLHGQNCVSHLGVYARKLLNAVGGLREGLEGAQDWDLALRCAEKLSVEEIGHIPRVLYHWRAIPGSTARGVNEKEYASDAGMRALREHFARVGTAARVSEIEGVTGVFRVRHPLPDDHPLVSIIVPTRDNVGLLSKCIDSILAGTTYKRYEIIVVDNQSSEPATLRYLNSLACHARVRVVKHDRPFNYSRINNDGVRHCKGSLICLLNNDVEVITPDWLEELVSHAVRPQVGAVGAMLYYPNDTIQHAGIIVGMHGVAAHPYSGMPRGYSGQMARARLTQAMSAVTAACMLVRRDVFEKVGGFDADLQVAYSDVDFCLRVRQFGYTNIWTPFAELYHWESASRGADDTPEKRERFRKEVDFMAQRWSQQLHSDPYYNPNLELSGEPFALAFPPRAADVSVVESEASQGKRRFMGWRRLTSSA